MKGYKVATSVQPLACQNWATVDCAGEIVASALAASALLGAQRTNEQLNYNLIEKIWLPPRDSNPDMLIQSQLSCR
jgi:hypothetical protein